MSRILLEVLLLYEYLHGYLVLQCLQTPNYINLQVNAHMYLLKKRDQMALVRKRSWLMGFF